MTGSHQPLAGMVAVVTGGAGGIGGATAEALVADGARVLIGGRTAETLKATAARLEPIAEAGGGAIAWEVCDSQVEADVARFVQKASELGDRLDIAVNTVGGGGGSIVPVVDGDAQSLEATLRQNITTAFHLVKHAGTRMVAQGGGSIVVVSSMQATEVAPRFGFYCASKAGLEMMCKVAADELGEHGVRVNIVRPGLVRNSRETHLTEIPDVLAAYFREQPLTRAGESADIGQAIRFLAGPESSWTTGAVLTVDGGNSLRRFPDLRFHWERAEH